MKKLLLLIIVLLVWPICWGQNKKVQIIMRNGVTLAGTLVEIEPTSHIKILIAGQEKTISMTDDGIPGNRDAAGGAI